LKSLRQITRQLKNAIRPLLPGRVKQILRRLREAGRRLLPRRGNPDAERGSLSAAAYADRLAAETEIFKGQLEINNLPAIFHYWSDKYLRPMLEEFGVSNPDEFFAKYLRESAAACKSSTPVFVSIGAGNCDTEVRIAQLLRKSGLERFTIECLDMNPHMLERGRELAQREGVAENLRFVEGDFNRWSAERTYAGIMANQSLHHVVNLEGLFEEVERSLDPRGYFVVSDMIGRNGHQRWPEALAEVQRFWRELPAGYRYNLQLQRHEELYINWDCSQEGFEGIRAQEILPLLLERFRFAVYIGFANVVDVFIDRAFGHHFKAEQAWDRDFVDRVHAFDEQALRDGSITPTHMMAVLTKARTAGRYSRGLSPSAGVRPA
jgi:SAM-dependent methyltransferase